MKILKKALVTIVIGEKYKFIFEKYCRMYWEKYADKHGYELFVFDKPLDESELAKSRNVSWQKCLILSQPCFTDCDRIVWIDADTAINPDSPDIADNVPMDKIGCVDEYSIPTPEDYLWNLKRLYNEWSERKIPFIPNLTPTEFHRQYGFSGDFNYAVQTGVLVMSPKYHKELLEYVYYNYKDKGGPEWNYEMRPLSYEILSKDIAYWLSPKFNAPWPIIKIQHYDFIFKNRIINKLIAKTRYVPPFSQRRKAVNTTFVNNYFLHFASTLNDMIYLSIIQNT
jgi:hypothetical protein